MRIQESFHSGLSNLSGKACVLAVGTELTTGQITNRNAPWISENLNNVGIEVVLHETVADDRKRIFQALDHCSRNGQLIFVTGGLGPTSDDFTREVISEWVKQPLEYRESAWLKIVDRLTRFGIPVAESNRQQCFFPKDAEILENPEGTAAGFSCTLESGQKIFILPGPPNEIRAIWKQGIEKTLPSLVPNLQPSQLFTWQCMGKSESELGEIVEKALDGSGLKIGYRAHRPFVEIKVWCPSSEISNHQHWFQKLEAQIQPWIMTRQGEDLGNRLLHRLQRSETIEIVDACTGGVLAQRLGTLLREEKNQDQAQTITLATEWQVYSDPSDWTHTTLSQGDEEGITLAIAGFGPEFTGSIGLKIGRKIFQKEILSPYKKTELLERARHFAVEIAFKQWCDWLDSTTQ